MGHGNAGQSLEGSSAASGQSLTYLEGFSASASQHVNVLRDTIDGQQHEIDILVAKLEEVKTQNQQLEREKAGGGLESPGWVVMSLQDVQANASRFEEEKRKVLALEATKAMVMQESESLRAKLLSTVDINLVRRDLQPQQYWTFEEFAILPKIDFRGWIQLCTRRLSQIQVLQTTKFGLEQQSGGLRSELQSTKEASTRLQNDLARERKTATSLRDELKKLQGQSEVFAYGPKSHMAKCKARRESIQARARKALVAQEAAVKAQETALAASRYVIEDDNA